MYKHSAEILRALEATPKLLKELVLEIDPKCYKQQLIGGKWTIHEHATHIAVCDLQGFQQRLKNFKNQDKPIIAPFSGDDYKPSFFLEIDLMQAIDDFFAIRAETLKQARALTLTDWDKTAIHPEYKIYTPYVLLRHLLMHDHSHLYKIEDMGFGITNKS
jgi:uncharacterized damage-inducible protein DinB